MSREAWQRRLGPLYGGAVALVHSTPWAWPRELADEARSPAWVVLLGAPLGLAAWAVAAALAAAGVAPAVAALLGLAALTLGSAALVERGLVARVDALAGDDAVGARPAPGVAGTTALVLVTLIRAVALLAVARGAWLGVFVATPVIGRWAAVFLQALGDPIADPPRRSLVASPAPAWLTAALGGGAIAIAVLALGAAGLLAVALAALGAFALGLDAQRRDRGLGAPVVAAAAALAELIVLVVATV